MDSRVASSALASALALVLAGCRDEGPTAPPCPDCNVVVISADTLRADHVGALGYPRPVTPNIDAIARRGVLFENAISQSSWTRPAHMSIFTGLHPREHGFVALGDTRPLEAGVPTLASVLKEHGYTTAAFVGGVNLTAAIGFDHGFDVFRSNGKNFRDNLEDARWWLDHNADKRFFLFFHGYDAHTPYSNDPVDRRDLALSAKPPEASLAGTCRDESPPSRILPFVDEYDAAVHRADRYIGKMFAELETRGLLDHTIVIILSDHGEEFLDHGRCFHISTLYREVLHVPVLVVAPGLAARRVAALVPASVSIAPTVMDLLGIRTHPFPGPSLASAAAGGPVPDGLVISETERSKSKRGDGNVIAVTLPDEKLIRWITDERSAWFDLATDAAEQHPVGAAAPGSRAEALALRLDEWIAAHPARFAERRRQETRPKAAPGSTSSPRDDERERRERLQSLGYSE